MKNKKKLLFVCLGNICRSPSAEAVMNHYITSRGLNETIQCDSAGIRKWHTGKRADSRTREHAALRNYKITSIARQFDPEVDFDRFDMILGMDHQNIADLQSMTRNESDMEKIVPILEFCSRYKDYNSVPDPYYGGADGFELVLDLLEDACQGLLNHIQDEC